MTSIAREIAVPKFLNEHAPADLAARYVHGMELQVNVVPGEPFVDDDGKVRHGWFRCGEDTYYGWRIKDADSAGKKVTYDLAKHYEAVGISGHDPCQGISHGVGFDFDSIAGHAVGIGLSDEALSEVLEKLKLLPYVEIRKSTSGNALHVWVWFCSTNFPETADRREHKALARAVLKKMSLEVGFDFDATVDHLGELLWIAARRATPENGGLSLIQAAEHPLIDYPTNWRDHLDVIKGKRRKSPFRGPSSETEADSIEAAFQDRPSITLDKEHRRFIEKYMKSDYTGFWNYDHGCFAAHTCGVKTASEECGHIGIFETNSPGTDHGTPNCFMYPREHGSWRVYRFSQGLAEHPCWESTDNSWTSITVNELPTGKATAKSFDGMRLPGKTEKYRYPNRSKATSALAAHGISEMLPKWLGEQRTVTLEYGRDRGVTARIPFKVENDETYLDSMSKQGWSKEKGPVWACYFDVELPTQQVDLATTADSLVRHVSKNGEQIGLFANSKVGWEKMGESAIRSFLKFKGLGTDLTPNLLGYCADNPWRKESIPFQVEYPGNRVWNNEGAQLLYSAATQPGDTAHWDLIFGHIGRGLDTSVAECHWCREHDISLGSDYLLAWYANLIRKPRRRLPLLFLYSPEQNTGKSMLYEGPALLFDASGFTRGDGALKNQAGFNGELDGTALCVVEETDLRGASDSYARIKSWLTSDTIHITYKGKDGYDTANYTHWVMTSNNAKYLPIEPGDQRVVMWEVPPFEGEEIPKEQLLRKLKDEAPYLLHKLFALDISDVCGRHTLPILLTDEKAEALKLAGASSDIARLPAVAAKAIKAIEEFAKPWEGTSTELCQALGDWDGNLSTKSVKARATSLGRQMRRIQPHLCEKGINLVITPGRTSHYALSV